MLLIEANGECLALAQLDHEANNRGHAPGQYDPGYRYYDSEEFRTRFQLRREASKKAMAILGEDLFHPGGG